MSANGNIQDSSHGTFCGVRFENENAADYFYELAELFYRGNFGTTPKAEIDLRMFDFFDRESQRVEGEQLTDFMLARKLGITPQMVRNRRTKIKLRDAGETSGWISTFLGVLEHKTYVLRKAKSGCEMKIMLPDKMSVYEFEDVLIRRHHYFDNSFNNLVVATPMSAVFDILFREIANVPLPYGCERQTILGDVLFRIQADDTIDPRVKAAAEKLWDDETREKVRKARDDAIQGATRGIGKKLVDALPGPLFGGIGLLDIKPIAGGIKRVASTVQTHIEKRQNREDASEADVALADVDVEGGELCDGVISALDYFEDPKNLSIDWDSFGETARESFEENGVE
ncbi:hypothetical protein [Adlercreutzia mucosicola]|uniref:hypothetical protein n=1 Tax=Adlercreutzia mucosicola TaxID=580026 RepID=UPI000489B006|nr:hypothetical protein [Adlercreutzia mucosicola]MCR2035545.1 hypothetical protein [Adlercreutzia mucosicola]